MLKTDLQFPEVSLMPVRSKYPKRINTKHMQEENPPLSKLNLTSQEKSQEAESNEIPGFEFCCFISILISHFSVLF